MVEPQRLSTLIGNIYDAALDPILWTSVVEKVGRFVGGSAASIFSRDIVHRTGNVYYQFGVESYYEQLYFDKCIKFDPLSAALLTLEVGTVTSSSDVIPYAEFIETRFYKEWVQPQGWVDNVLTVLERSPTSLAAFVAFRHEREGIATDATCQLLRLIAPHLRRALLIGKVIDLKTIEAATFADTVDGLSAGMFLVDATGRLVHANVAGHAILRAGDFLRAANGRLVAGDPQINQILQDVFIAAGKGHTAIGSKGVAITLIAQDGERHVAHLLPLTSGARRKAGIAYSAVAAVFVHKTAINLPHPLETIASTFKLTPAELRVVMMVIQLAGVPEIAPALGVSAATVKTHLQRIFSKTNTSRQADLVKLVAGYMSPLGH